MASGCLPVLVKWPSIANLASVFKGGAAFLLAAPPLPSSLQLWRSFHEICAFCFFLILASALTGHGARYAVIIGIADYPREENDLSYTVNDATAVTKVLLKDKAWDEGNVIVLLNEEATKGAVADILSLLADKASTHDLLFFYFSGHGTAAPDTPPYDEHDSHDEYICTYGTSFEEFIRDDELSAWLASIPVGTLVVALDACYSGGQIRTSIGRVKALSTCYYPMKGDGFAVDLKRLRLRLKDLGDLDREVVILTSSAENELSWELGPPFSHGLFTYYFLEAMRGKADIEGNEDGMVSAEECFFYLSPRVREISRLYGLNQNPQLFDNYQGEAVLINRYPMLCEKWETVLKPGWHMISLPGEICGPNDPDTVLGDDVSPLYLFHYEPELGRYSMYPPAGEISLVPGKSYWIHLSEVTILDAELRQISGDEFVTVVSSGWNMIGNPFPFDVALSKLKVRHGDEELSLIEAQNRQWVSAYLFGYDPIEIQIGRGVLEALGIGFHLGPNDVAARGNFATIHDGVVVDRRAGRISSEECSRLIKKLSEHIKSIDGVEVILRPGKEHRFVAIFRGEGLSDKLSDADPQKDHMPLVEAKPLAAEASRTADVVNKFIRKANEILRDEPQANGVLLRGFAKSPKIEPFPEKYQLRAVALAVYPMYKGLTRLLGLETPDVGETFEDEVKALKELWNNYDFFYIHFKDTDKAGEDGDFELKVKKIEYFDKFVPVFVDLNPDVLVITGDHSTPAIIGGHSWHPNPTLLHSKVAGVDDARFFTEKECAKGYLGIFK